MASTVLIIGTGEVARTVADRLAGSGRVDRIVLAGLAQGHGDAIASVIESCHAVGVKFVELEALNLRDVERVLSSERPDLVVNAAALISPWQTIDRRDVVAKAIKQAGFSVEVPAQLPILMRLMQAVREVGIATPVANFSYPDLLHPILAPLGLAPTVGLGNAGIQWLRARANLRRRLASQDRQGPLPLVRVIGQLWQIYDVYAGCLPQDASRRCEVYLGETGERDDAVAYAGAPMPVTMAAVTAITVAAALPVLLALLRAEDAVRFSTPAPNGLPGGYPVRIESGEVSLDLPSQLDLDDVVQRQWRNLRREGVQGVDADGTLTFTPEACAAVAAIDPLLCEPLTPADALSRFRRLQAALAR